MSYIIDGLCFSKVGKDCCFFSQYTKIYLTITLTMAAKSFKFAKYV